MTTLQFRFLGPLEIVSRERQLPKPATLKSQSLLAYLVVHRQQPHPRERLAGTFWGDRAERKARSSLSTALWHIRRCLPAQDFLLGDRQSVQVDPDAHLWLDVDEFVAQASQDDEDSLQSALALYRGSFLDGFYHDWIISERYRLQALFADALERLMRLREADGDPRGVLATAKRLLNQDALREDAHRAAMRAYRRLGRRNAALEQYARCKEVLLQELDASPMAATTALYRDIRDGGLSTAPLHDTALGDGPLSEAPPALGRSPLDAALSTELVGRERELTLLRARWQRAASGSGGLVLISGEAGVGKTRLAEALADRVRWRGGSVLWGRCYELSRALPYQPFSEALRGALPTIPSAELSQLPTWVLRETSRLVPALSESLALIEARALSEQWSKRQPQPDGGPVEGAGLERGRLLDAVTRLLTELASRSPFLLVLEDLQWAGDSTMRLLSRLARQLPEHPMLTLGTFRPEATTQPHPLCALERDLARERLVDRIHLSRLAQEATRALVRTMSGLGQAIDPLARRLHQETLGNPFFLVETVRALFETDQLCLQEGVWQGDFARISDGPLPTPARLREVVRARSRRLDDPSQDALRQAAVLGVSFDFDLLRTAWGRDMEDTLVALDAMLQRRLIEEARGPAQHDYAFSHHKIQEVVYRDIERRRRQHLHARAATALEALCGREAEGRAAELAYHFEQAQRLDEAFADKAIHYLLRAGDQARGLRGCEEAIDWYDRALGLLKEKGQHGRAARTLMKMGLAYHDDFDFKSAQMAYDDGFALWQRATVPRTGVRSRAERSLHVSCAEPVSLDPVQGYDVLSLPILNQLFRGLLARSPDMGLVPDVAERWTILDDGLRYVFHLRDDVQWSDGAPLTAGDFAHAWKRALDPELGCAGATLLYDIRGAKALHQGAVSDPGHLGVTAPDEATLVVDLEQPVATFLHVLDGGVTYPVPQHVLETQGETWTEVDTLVTNGPFTLEAWHRGEQLVLTKNPRYHGTTRGNVGTVKLMIVEEPQEALTAYDADRVDVLHMDFYPPALIERQRWVHAGEYVCGPPLDPSYLAFCLARPPFDDRRVRRALALAIDREKLAGIALRGTCAPAAGGVVPPSVPGHTTALGPSYDPDRAREMLRDAGFPGGRGLETVTILTHADPLSSAASSYLGEQWCDVLGIACRPEAMEWEDFFSRMRASPPHAVLWGWIIDHPDPDNVLRVGMEQILPFTHWQRGRYTDLVERARRVRDQEKRLALYREAERLLVEEGPILPLTHMRSHTLVKPWVRGVPTSSVRGPSWEGVHVEPH